MGIVLLWVVFVQTGDWLADTNYSLNNKNELEAFLLDGRLELTNNRAERAVKPFVMDRKNWLFADTNKGADASMM